MWVEDNKSTVSKFGMFFAVSGAPSSIEAQGCELPSGFPLGVQMCSQGFYGLSAIYTYMELATPIKPQTFNPQNQ